LQKPKNFADGAGQNIPAPVGDLIPEKRKEEIFGYEVLTST